MTNVDDLLHELRSALSEKDVVELDDRLDRAGGDRSKIVGAMLRMAWHGAKNAPTIAQKIKDWADG
jgi:hypothetical protein